MFDFVISPIAIGIFVLILTLIKSKSIKNGIGLGILAGILTLIVQFSFFLTCTNGENYAKHNWGLVYDTNELGVFTILFSFIIPALAIGSGCFICCKVFVLWQASSEKVFRQD